jgi:hypothetical protein
MKYWMTIIFSWLVIQNSFAQDTRIEVSFLLNLLLFQESTTHGIEMNKELFDQFNSLQVSWDTLQAENFDDFIFLSVSPSLKNPRNISMDNFSLTPNNCKEYVVCFSKDVGQMFRLKGFKNNDFPSFMLHLKKKGYVHLKSRSTFVKHYAVERLDLGCLFEAFKALDANTDRFRCIQTCSDNVTTH